MMSPLRRPRTKTIPVAWTIEEEIRLVKELRKGDVSHRAIAEKFPQRSLVSVRNKIRKVRIRRNMFGAQYRDDKFEFTLKVAKAARPKIVFEAYAGSGRQTTAWLETAGRVVACDHSKSQVDRLKRTLRRMGFVRAPGSPRRASTYTRGRKVVHVLLMDAVDGAAWTATKLGTVDLVDLDTCGSTLPSLPVFLALLQPAHLVITHGEFHSFRFGRKDVMRRLLVHRSIGQDTPVRGRHQLAEELDLAVRTSALRSRNEAQDSFDATLKDECWLGMNGGYKGMLRRHYVLHHVVVGVQVMNRLAARLAE